MKLKAMKDNNKGFSLLEILVVIAIMAVLATISAVAFNIVNRANIEKAANAFQSAYTKARSISMAKGEEAGKLTIWAQDGYYYYCIGDTTSGTGSKLCSDGITIKYDNNTTSAAEGTNVYNGASFTITFNSAGMVKSNTLGGNRFTFTKRAGRVMEFLIMPVSGKSKVTKYFQ